MNLRLVNQSPSRQRNEPALVCEDNEYFICTFNNENSIN